MSQNLDRKRHFGEFELDLETGELERGGERVALQEKPFQLLAALLERPGRLVTREELAERMWPGVHVDFDANLNAAARKLREALADSASEPRFVETVPRRGYRFAAELTPAAEAPAARQRFRRRFPWLVAAVPLALVLAVLVGFRWRTHRGPDGERVLLVVLPFENLSGDPSREFVSDGMTEELITALGRIDPQRLGVIARVTAMTYKDTSKSVDAIGRELGVDYVLEGSLRGTPEKARITAQLIAVADQTHLWAETYDADLEDLLGVQADVARRIAGALTLELLEDPRAATSVPEAYDHYLRARHEWNRFTADGYRVAIAEFQHAIELDPGYAAAHAGLADAYNLSAFVEEGSPVEWFARARRSAETALALDPKLAAAHNALAFAILYGEYDAATADPIFERALELDPNAAMAYHWRAGALAALGRHDEAIASVRRALELDPLSLSVRSDLGWYFLFARRWDDAIGECRRTLDMSPGYGWAVACLVEALLQKGESAEAIPLIRKQLQDAGVAVDDSRVSLDALLKILLEREMKKDDAHADFVYRALLLARLGELDQAMDWLEVARERHVPWLVFLGVDPRFDPLREHPRFQEFVANKRRIILQEETLVHHKSRR